eukprot:11256617-Heterocapsa_arctica.AAC.1
MLYEHIGKGQSKIPACELHEDRIRIITLEIQGRDGRGVSYRHGSSTNSGGHKQRTLMVQTKEHNKHNHIGYIMFEDLGNKEDASRSQTKVINHGNNNHVGTMKSVESIMEM